MWLLFLIFGFAAADEANKNYNRRRKYSGKKHRKSYRNDSWLDAAWFHDHNQKL